MTLDEAIKHAEEVAEKKFDNAVYIMDKMKSDVALRNAEECKKCAEEHRQLAEWLKDYKRLLEQEPILDKIRAEIAQEIILRNSDQYDDEAKWYNIGLRKALKVIDKYKAESEG